MIIEHHIKPWRDALSENPGAAAKLNSWAIVNASFLRKTFLADYLPSDAMHRSLVVISILGPQAFLDAYKDTPAQKAWRMEPMETAAKIMLKKPYRAPVEAEEVARDIVDTVGAMRALFIEKGVAVQ